MKLFILTVLCFAAMCAGKAPKRSINDLYHAIHMVEASGKLNPKDGDGGKAIGPYQIHYVYWKDATDFDKSIGGSYQDCRKKDYAEKVMLAYWRRYVPDALKNGDFEVLARTHNGGWNGRRVNATKKYWERVKEHL